MVRNEHIQSNTKKVRAQKFEKIVPHISHVKVAHNNYSKVPIGDNDSIKNMYRDNYGTYVDRLDKQRGTRERFNTSRARSSWRDTEPKHRYVRADNVVEEGYHTPSRRHSEAPKPTF